MLNPASGLGRLNWRCESGASPNDATARHNLPMTVLTAIIGSIASVIPNRTDSDTGPTGADAVRTAISEIEGLQDSEFTAVLGEPDIIQGNGRYFSEPKIVIPLRETPYNTSDQLVFDFPEGRDDEWSHFNELLDIFGVSFENMEDLDGGVVPVKFFGGNATVDWRQIAEPPDESESHYTRHTDEDAMEAVDDDSPVTTEETTISADENDGEEGDD